MRAVSVRRITTKPYADDLASLALDLIVSGAGWSRHVPNPLLLMS
jgi:FdhE protein